MSADLDEREKTLVEERRDIGRDGKALGDVPEPGDSGWSGWTCLR